MTARLRGMKTSSENVRIHRGGRKNKEQKEAAIKKSYNNEGEKKC